MNVTPDGHRYLAAARGERVARPFHYRWLVPKLLGATDGRRWHYANRVCLGALLPLTWWYVGGWRGVAAALAVPGLAGVWSFNRRFPVLVDAEGMAIALASADCFRHSLWPLGLVLTLFGGCVRETSPVWAALYAWNPLALVGLAPVAMRHLQREGPDVLDDANAWVLKHPLRASAQFHLGKQSNPDLPCQRLPRMAYVLPWGVALLALANPSWQLAAALVAAYATVAVATDTVRLYQWAFPVMLASAVALVPERALALFVVAALVNPFASEGT